MRGQLFLRITHPKDREGDTAAKYEYSTSRRLQFRSNPLRSTVEIPTAPSNTMDNARETASGRAFRREDVQCLDWLYHATSAPSDPCLPFSKGASDLRLNKSKILRGWTCHSRSNRSINRVRNSARPLAFASLKPSIRRCRE